jgi:transposase
MKQGVLMDWGRIREILRLWGLGQSQGQIALSAGVARSTVQDYLRRAQVAGISVELVGELSEAELLEKLGKVGGHRGRIPVELDYAWVTNELRKKGVTLDLLFRELVREGRMPVSYATFCRRVKEHEKRTGVVLRQIYNPGEYWLIDYAGLTVPIWDSRLQNILFYAQVFVGTLGASGLIFAEATPSQKIEHILGSHVRAFEFYGGVPIIVVPDNLKSGVKKAIWHEPELTRAYQELAEHYGLVVLPTRVKKPRDKGKVERAVLDVERHVLAPLRNEKFTSVTSLNRSMLQHLEALTRISQTQ